MRLINVIKLILIALVILVIFHLKKYKKYSEEYEIEQQELDYLKGDELYNTTNPLIITFIENNTFKYNIETYNLYSAISLKGSYFNLNTNDKYHSHKSEIMIIRPNKDMKIELVNPKYNRYFEKIKNSDIVEYKLDESNYDKVATIEIILHEYNLLYIPRFWLFSIANNESNDHLEIFTCHNIFTYLFNIFN